MRKWSLKLKLIRVLFALVLSFCCALGVFGASDYSVYAITTSDISSYVSVGELWDSSNKSFNSDNVKILYKYLTGNANATLSNVRSIISSTTYAQVPASTIRANAIASGTQGSTSYDAKTAEKDIVVTMGGLKWQVVYLSDDMDGNPILTLWLSNSTQSAWADRTSDEGEYYGFIDGGLYSDWSADWCDDSFSETYPSSVYGSSYIRAVTLNNGGDYATGISSLEENYEKSEDSVFADFTIPATTGKGLTDFLVTPSNVQWQQYQSAKTSANYTYSFPNDAWGSDVCNSFTDAYENTYNFYIGTNGEGNYSNASDNPNINNDAWTNDYLWLPSFTETGYDDTHLGIWNLSIQQRNNSGGSTQGSVGTTSGSAGNASWLRSGSNLASMVNVLPASGDGFRGGDRVNNSDAVRPALHLNLSAVDETLSTVEVGEIWDSESKTINEDNAKILLKYITGKKSATFGDVANLAQYTYSASKMRANTLDTGIEGITSYSSKSAEQDIVVTLGGLKWHVTYLSEDMDGNPILTLWLSNSTQEAFAGRSATEGEYYGFIDGGLYSEWSYNMSNKYFNVKFPTSVYGCSYINAVTLNNGGTYATSVSATTSYTKSPTSVFAKFTIPSTDKDLTDFIVTPSNVLWQKYQSATTSASMTYSYPNDAWGDVPSSGIDDYENLYKFHTTSYGEANFAPYSANSNEFNDGWINSYLWLPSMSETGYNDSKLGMWKLSTFQRLNYDGKTAGIVKSNCVGTSKTAAYSNTFLRSGFDQFADSVISLKVAGSSFTNLGTRYSAAVRPALHLNLNAIMAEMDEVEVGELWNADKRSMNQDNVKILMNYITGRTNAKLADINSLAGSTFTAQQMRSTTISDSGVLGLRKYSPKFSGQDIVVTLGGLKWHVTYLSKDMDGNPILTLWLSNSTQDAFNGRSPTEGQYYGFIDCGLYSDWSFSNYYSQYFDEDYPSSVYGSSYIRSVTLNNGGEYIGVINTDTYQIYDFIPTEGSVFAEFTTPDNETDLTDFLVTPSKVKWQQYQSAKTSVGTQFSYPNDAWASDVCNSLTTDSYGNTYNFNTHDTYGQANYSEASANPNEYNDAWIYDYLWLPSVTETGYNDTNLGMWGLSISQRQNYDGSTMEIGSTVGTDNFSSLNLIASAQSWLRSGSHFNSGLVFNLEPTGLMYDSSTLTYSYAVRPALHLNLKAMVDDSNFVEVGELWNENSASMDENNVNILLKYLTGDSSHNVNDPMILDEVNTLAANVITAADLRATELSAGNSSGVDYCAKKNGQDIIVTLGGLKWHVTYLSKDKDGNPILTLWLSNSTQDAFCGRSSTEGEYYGFIDGGLYSDWSYNFSNSYFKKNYPSSVYGSSYIRAVTLNNGGDYATSSTTKSYAVQSDKSIFAKFTIPNYEQVDLTDFLVTPASVKWQEYQSCLTIGVYENYTLPNEAWSNAVYTGYDDGAGNTYNFNEDPTYGTANYANNTNNPNRKSYNDVWKDDYLWLPSRSEASYLGLWNLSEAQRQYYDGSISGDHVAGNVGTANGSAYMHSWLRSGSSELANYVHSMNPIGTIHGATYVNYSFAVRPALHINLKKLIYGPGGNDLTDTEQAEIYLESESSEYDGRVKSPKIIIKYNGEKLILGQDYIRIDRKDNSVINEIKDAGFYIIIVRGKGIYESDVLLNYTVTKKSITTAIIGDIPDYEYTGRLITPLVLLESELPMVKDVDYRLSYTNNIDIGTATVIVTGIGNYDGEISKTFNILGRDINDADITYVADIISPNKDIAIKLTYEGRMLIKDTDYTLSYSDNINYGECIVTITGIGGWFGTRTVNAVVGQMSIVDNVAVMFSFKDVLFSETAQEPVVRLIYFDRDLVEDTDYTIKFYRDGVETTDFTNTGTINIEITGIVDWKDVYTNSYSILQKNISASSISVLGLKDAEWTGDEINPEIVLLNNGIEIDPEESYDYEISNNTDVGVATIKLTGKGNYKGTRILTFNITKATPVVDVIYDTESIYYEGYSAPEITLNNASVPGTFKVTNSANLVIGNNAYNWTFTPDDSEHYSVVNGTTEILALKDDVIGMKLSGSYKTKYQALSTLDISEIVVGLEFTSGKKLTLTSEECNYNIDGLLQVGDIVTISPKDYPEISKILDIEIKPIEIAITFDNYTGIKENGKNQNIDILVNGKSNTNIPLKVTYLNTRLNTESDSIYEYGDYVVNVELLDGNYVISSIEPCNFNVEKNNFVSITNSNINILLNILISMTILSLVATIMFIQNSRKKFERFKKFSTVHND